MGNCKGCRKYRNNSFEHLGWAWSDKKKLKQILNHYRDNECQEHIN